MDKLRILIAKGNTSEALEFLMKDKYGHSHQKEILILNNRYNSIKLQNIKGVLKNEDYTLEVNKINSDLIDLIEQIDKNVQYPGKKTNYKKHLIFIPIIVVLGIAYFYWSFKPDLEIGFSGFKSPNNYNILVFPFKNKASIDIEDLLCMRLDQFKVDNSIEIILDCQKIIDFDQVITYDLTKEIGRRENAKFVLFGSTYKETDSINVNLKYQSLLVDSIKSTSGETNYYVRYESEIEKGEITGIIEEAILKTLHIFEVNQFLDSIDLAIQRIDSKIENSPIQGFLYSLRGNLNIRADNFNQSKSDYEKAIELSPLNYIPYNNLGVMTMLYFEDKSKMLYYFEKAYELSGGKESILQNIQAVKRYIADKLTPKEIKTKIKPKIVEPILEEDKFKIDKVRAKNAFERGKENLNRSKSIALKDFEEAVKYDPENGIYSYYLGRTYSELGKSKKAGEYFKNAISLGAKEHFVFFDRANNFSSLGMIDSAITNYKLALEKVEKTTDKIVYKIKLGDAYLKKRNRKNAIKEFSDAIDLGYTKADMYCKRGKSYIDYGDYESAIIDLNTAIEKDPNNYEYYLERSSAYYKLGDMKKGDADIQKMKKLQLKNK